MKLQMPYASIQCLLKPFLVLCVLTFSTACAGDWSAKMKPHIQAVDLEQYAGTWYEVARFPHRFERNLTGVTVTYTLKPDGHIEVVNKGFKGDLNGPIRKARGKAKPAGNPSFGHLRVSFFWIFYADYFILDLDQQHYQWALVGSSSPNFLWILSRSPQMDADIFDRLVNKAKELGYEVSRIEKVPQPKL